MGETFQSISLTKILFIKFLRVFMTALMAIVLPIYLLHETIRDNAQTGTNWRFSFDNEKNSSQIIAFILYGCVWGRFYCHESVDFMVCI